MSSKFLICPKLVRFQPNQYASVRSCFLFGPIFLGIGWVLFLIFAYCFGCFACLAEAFRPSPVLIELRFLMIAAYFDQFNVVLLVTTSRFTNISLMLSLVVLVF